MKKIFFFLIITSIVIINGCGEDVKETNNNPSVPVLTSPSDNATDVKTDASLNWNACSDPDKDVVKYNVLFGTVNPPTSIVSTSQNGTIFIPTLLEKQTYYWKIVAVDGKGGISESPVWSFTTIANTPTPINNNPSIPILTSPADQAKNIKLNATLEWEVATDLDGDVVKYNVLFGTNYPPDVTVSSSQTANSYTPVLSNSTIYYWQITSTDGKGGTSQSEIRGFTTISNTNSNPPSIPNLVKPLDISTNIPLNEVINWNKCIDPDGDEVKYNVYFSSENPPSLAQNSSSDTFFIPSLVSNTTYFWKIIASDVNGVTSESETRTFTTLNESSTAVSLFSPPNNSTKIKLNEVLKWNAWKTTSGGTVKYNVFFGIASSPTTQVSSDQLTTTYTPSLTAGNTYYWKVTTNDGNGNTAESEIWSFSTISNPPPKPTLTSPSKSATNIPLNQTLNWDAIVDGNNIIKYSVYFGTASPPSKIVSALQSTNSFTPTLSGNKTYYWKIVADNGQGGQSESDIWSFKTINNVPAKPSLISPVNLATDINNDEILKWNISIDPDGDIVKYNVFIGTTDPPTIKVTSLLSSTSYSPSLAGNTKYYWKISADDESGGETESDVRSFTTKIVVSTIPLLTTPDKNAINVSLNPNLTWNASTNPEGDVFKYNVFFDIVKIPVVKVSSLQAGTSYAVTNLKSNTIYYWKIVADNEKGGVYESEIRNFKTIIVPPNVPNLIAPNNFAINLKLNSKLIWNKCFSSSGYDVKYNVYLGTDDPPKNKVSERLGDTFYLPTLLSNTQYYWKIEADDGNGGLASSEVLNFMTITPPSVPVLSLPENNAKDVSTNTTLEWVASTGTSSRTIRYNVYLGTNEIPVNKVSSFQTGTTFSTSSLNLKTNTTYYWKVEAVDGNALVSVSEIRYFKTVLIPPSNFTLISPVNGVTNQGLSIKLEWNASTSSVGLEVKYNVFFDTTSNPVAIVSKNQSETSYTVNLVTNTTYYWKIVADDGNGGTSVSEIRSFKTYDIIYDLVYVEGGTFKMGCTQEQVNICSGNLEYPVRSVTLTSYLIGKYEVTQSLWVQVMGSNPSDTKCNNCPVEFVSWYTVESFINILNVLTGKKYRLPTEAEWEYAARGGNKSQGYIFSGGNDTSQVAWYYANTKGALQIVGTKRANELGIYDMSGNVTEWVSDWYGSYSNEDQTDPTGPASGQSKVYRGGSWNTNEISELRVSDRSYFAPTSISYSRGFRLALPK